jgi:preprotein translocase subunit SecE
VARNRKRAKERRARRPQERPFGRPAIATARAEEAPDPIEHGTPDVELADAQLAYGRPEVGDNVDLSADAEAAELEEEREDGAGGYGGPPDGGAVVLTGGDGEARGRGAVTEARVGIFARLIGFLQGSWRELQRVQWPDRRQVAQATGVVIGFVIVAGVFLGLADLVAQKLVNFIING